MTVLKVSESKARMLLVCEDEQCSQSLYLNHLHQSYVLVRVLLMYIEMVVVSFIVEDKHLVHDLLLTDFLIEYRIQLIDCQQLLHRFLRQTMRQNDVFGAIKRASESHMPGHAPDLF